MNSKIWANNFAFRSRSRPFINYKQHPLLVGQPTSSIYNLKICFYALLFAHKIGQNLSNLSCTRQFLGHAFAGQLTSHSVLERSPTSSNDHLASGNRCVRFVCSQDRRELIVSRRGVAALRKAMCSNLRTVHSDGQRRRYASQNVVHNTAHC